MKKGYTIALLVLTTIIAEPVSIYSSTPIAKIQYKSNEYDFGKVAELGGRVSTIIEFVNTGTAPLILSNVRASCGCVVPTWSNTSIAPGHKGTIEVVYNPNGRPGRFQKTITITSNADEPVTKFYIKGEVLPGVYAINDNGDKGSSKYTDNNDSAPASLSIPPSDKDRAIEEVARKLYARMATERRIAHIAVKCSENASPEEEAEARKKIAIARERVTKGSENFASVALEVSDDPAVGETLGELGWIQMFRYLKEIEDVTYNTPVGQVSEVCRTPFGFHIVLVEEEVPREEVDARHIMIVVDQTDKSGNSEKRAKARIDSIFNVLSRYPDKFEELAQSYSEDRGSSKKGGDLGWFSRGTMVKEFEEQAFIQQKGKISRPFRTKFGWHILQVIERRGLRPYEGEVRAELFRQIQRSKDYMLEVNSLLAGGQKSITISKDFALLEIVDNIISFQESSNDNAIGANESGHILFKVKNTGKGEANDCFVKIGMKGDTEGINLTPQKKLSSIKPSEIIDIDVPFVSNASTKDGNVTFEIEVVEPNGFGTDPMELSVLTRAFVSPLLQIVDYAVTGANGGALVKRKPFNLQLMLQNTKHGNAENVEVSIILPNNVFLLDGNEHISYKSLEGGKAKSIDYQLIVNNNYSASAIPIEIKIKEKYGKYAENKSISLQLNQTLASNKLNIQAIESDFQQDEIKLAAIGSAVDRDIPVSLQHNENTLVLIVANEHYQSMPTVPYAVNDGNIFKEYCVKALGIPQENVMYLSDVTLNGLRQKVALLQKKSQARAQAGKDTHIIFYYTGHGMPDVNTQSAYLMPIDGFDENVYSGYKLDDLYQQLAQMPASAITVFLDACFSGVNRNDKALAVHKGARLTAKSGAPTGNMVIFAASQGNQTASVNDEEGHGLFTYFILEKLKATKGEVSLKELADYLSAEVNMKSLNLFEKEQIPSVVASPEVEDQWQNWKLK